MKLKINNKYFRWGLTAFLVIVAAIAFYYFLFRSSNIRAGFKTVINILMPVVFGLVIAYLLTPILNFVETKMLVPLCNKCKLKETAKRRSIIRGISILITAFLFLALIYMLFSMLISQIFPSVQGLIINFDTYTNNVIRWINQTLKNNPEISENIVKTLDRFSAQFEDWLSEIIPSTAAVIRTVSSSVMNVLDVLWDFIIGFIISIYVLASKEVFAAQAKKLTYALFEKETANTVVRNFRFTHQTFIGFIGGKIVDSIIIGILCFIGTSLMKTPYAVLVSVIIGVTNVIPFFGPYLGAIPSAVLIFVVDPMHPLNCVYFLIFILVLQQFDGNILGPKILGSSTGLTGFWVIFAITLFGGLFGILGMIVGVPIFAVIYAAVRSVVNTALEQKALPKETMEYERVDYIDDLGLHHISAEEGNSGKKTHTFSLKPTKTQSIFPEDTDAEEEDLEEEYSVKRRHSENRHSMEKRHSMEEEHSMEKEHSMEEEHSMEKEHSMEEEKHSAKEHTKEAK